MMCPAEEVLQCLILPEYMFTTTLKVYAIYTNWCILLYTYMKVYATQTGTSNATRIGATLIGTSNAG